MAIVMCANINYLLVAILICFHVHQLQTCIATPADEKPVLGIKGHESDYHHECDYSHGSQLPRSVKPVHYKIQLIPFTEGEKSSTEGEVWITIECMEPTDKIILNTDGIEVSHDAFRLTDVTLHSPPEAATLNTSSEIKVIDHINHIPTQTCTLTLGEALVKGRRYLLYIKFQGKVSDRQEGLYRRSFLDSISGQMRNLAATHLSPTHARKVFPCFDEPNFKASFQLSLARSSNKASLSNMPIKSTEPVTHIPGWEWDHYVETPVMPTYSVGFIIYDRQAFESMNVSNEHNHRVTIWARKSNLPLTHYAASIVPRILHYIEHYLNIECPLPKLDIVAVPELENFRLGNWGLIFLGESAAFYNKDTTTAGDKEWMGYAIAQNVVSQWFGNLVTPGWWNDFWLSSGFSMFFRYQSMNYVEPEMRGNDKFINDHLHTALKSDALESSDPVSVKVDLPAQVQGIPLRVVFSKAASIIRMMRNFLSEPTFKRGLSKFIEQHQYGNVCQDDLWAAMTTEANADGSLPSELTVKKIMDTWTLQRGYPLVTVTRNYETGTANIRQERFLQDSKKSSDKTSSTWWVPLTFTTQELKDFNSTQPQVWLKNEPSVVVNNLPGNKMWVLFNVQQSGFYRVNYDENNWKLLTASFEELPDVTRAQLLDDALNLALSGLLSYDTALSLTAQLVNDKDYFPWSSALSELEHLDTLLALTPAYRNFSEIMLKLLDGVYTSLQFESQQGDSYSDILTRAKIVPWACRFDNKQCVSKAVGKYKQCMVSDDRESICQVSADQKEVVYCTAIRQGGDAEWTFAWKKYLASDDENEREQLLSVLGCSRNQDILNSYLSHVISNTSNSHKLDGVSIFTSVAKNTIGYPLALKFLQDNWDDIQNYYGSSNYGISQIVSAVTTYMNTPSQLQQLEELKAKAGDNPNTAKIFERAIGTVKSNIKWMEDNYSEVSKWFSSYLQSH